MKRDTGGPAFPVSREQSDNGISASSGMTLRDYFAAKAMQGIFSFWVDIKSKTIINDPDPKIISEMAYEYADAMLVERSKRSAT